MTAAAIGFGAYLIGFIASFWLPESAANRGRLFPVDMP
jgi:hypothetical protein